MFAGNAFKSLLLSATVLLAGPSMAQSEPAAAPVDWNNNDSVIDWRLKSFAAGKYDPLTVPPKWFAPWGKVDGATTQPQSLPSARKSTISADALGRAADYARSQGSQSLIVLRQGAVELEDYWNGTDRNTLFNPQSMSKTLAAMLIGVAIADGRIGSADDTVERYITEWRGQPRGKITIRNLLQMASGLEHVEKGMDVSASNPGVRQYFGNDFTGPVLTMQPAEAPGKTFDYNNNNTTLLSVILERVTGKSYARILSDTLWKPLGLSDGGLYLDRPGGRPMVSCCVFSRPLDWARLGQMILARGQWQGKSVVPASWLVEMAKPSPANRHYGLQLWVGDGSISPRPTGRGEWQSAPYAAGDLVFMSGFGFQRVWIVPSRDLVIVRTGASWPKDWDDAFIVNTVIQGIERP